MMGKKDHLYLIGELKRGPIQKTLRIAVPPAGGWVSSGPYEAPQEGSLHEFDSRREAQKKVQPPATNNSADYGSQAHKATRSREGVRRESAWEERVSVPRKGPRNPCFGESHRVERAPDASGEGSRKREERYYGDRLGDETTCLEHHPLCWRF